eukprot:s44_g36.t1
MIDSDLQACAAYCINHKVTVFDANTLPVNFVDLVGHGCAIHGDAASHAWLPAIAKWNPEIITLSSPCQPWSKASTGRGLSCSDGMLLIEGLLQSRWLQPSAICLEQVSGFSSHDHKAMVMKVISMIGYAICWSKSSDLSHFAPVHRARWLAVLRKVTDATPCISPTIRIPEADPCNPKDFQALFAFRDALDPQLRISDAMMKVIQNHAYLPAAKKRKTDQTPLELRTLSPTQKIPVIMAAYGRQHLFSHDTLKERGCLAHFIHDDIHGPRLLHPTEIALLHGLTDRYFANADFTMAWKFLGNMIAPVHALMTLQVALQTLPSYAERALTMNVFQTWKDHRMKQGKAILTAGPAGAFLRHMVWEEDLAMSQHAIIADFFNNHSKGFLPPGKCWNVHGFHAVCSERPCIADPLDPPQHDLFLGSPLTPVQHSDASDTLPFCITLRAMIHQPNWQQVFWVASDVTPGDIAMLWRTSFRADMQNGECHLYPQPESCMNLEHTLLPCLIDNRLTIFNATERVIRDFCEQMCATDHVFDQFGPIATHQKYSQDLIILTHPIVHACMNVEPLYLLAACQTTIFLFQYDADWDCWHAIFTGDELSRKTIASAFANAISKASLQEFGRCVHVRHELSESRVIFSPAECGNAVPPSAFPLCLAVALTRSFLDALTSDQGMPVEIKCWSRPLWSGTIKPDTSAEVIKALLMFSLSPVMKLREVRLVHKTKQFASGPITLCADPANPDRQLKFFVEFERCGGAGPTSTKGQIKQQTRNSLAAWMLERGVELTWIHQNLEQIIDDVGPKKFIPVIQQSASAKRDSQLLQILHDASVQLPAAPAKVLPTVQKMKNRRKSPLMPEPCDFQVDCNFLLREDGQPTSPLQDIRPNATGVFLTNESGAAPWIQDSQIVSADELGILVLGPFTIPTQLPKQEVVLPSINADGQQVLLQLTLIQLGEKKLHCKGWDKTATTATTSKICALTLWKQDWSDDEWRQAVDKTTWFIRDILHGDGLQTCLSSVWGRSFRQGKQQCQPRDATSVQVHAAISDGQFLTFLKTTGHNRIWAAPKAETGRLTDDFRILWLQSNVDPPKAAAISAKLAGVAGLVRGKSSLGIRVQSGMFDQAWKATYPQEPVPIDASNKWVYKLEPLPYGCNHAMLLEWSQHVNWVIRPLRATGPKSWLVCSGNSPPAGPLAFNGHPILPRLMQRKEHSSVQPILAGPRRQPVKALQTQPSSMPAQGLISDPWMRYRQMNGQAPATAASALPATVTGPNEQRFVQQEAKVQELEQKIEALQTTQVQHGTHLTQISNDLATTEAKIADKVNASMLQVKNELNASFGDALALQSKQFEANFRDLKAVLMQSKRKTPEKLGDEMSD